MDTTMPMDMVMYWRKIDDGSWDEPGISAPIWEFCDEDEAPTSMLCSDADGCVLLEVEG